MKVEIKDESLLLFIRKPRETMNLLIEVSAVANGTLYLLRSVESAFREGERVKEGDSYLYSFLLGKE